MLKRRRRLGLLAALLIVMLVPLGTQAQAEDMAGDWNLVATSTDPCAKVNPVRSGYYDLGTGGGWGWWKISYKHGIDKVNVWRKTMTSSCGNEDAPGSTTWIYRWGFQLRECNANGTNCQTLDSVTVRSVNQRALFSGQRKGTITMYCEGYNGFCPSWINDYGNTPRVQARNASRGMTGKFDSHDEAPDVTKVVGFVPPPVAESEPDTSAAAVAVEDRSSRSGMVLAALKAQLPNLTFGFTPTIQETRQPDANTVEIIYSYPGVDGLIGLRRDVSVQDVDVAPEDPAFALAANENNPVEIATMLRVALEEPPPLDSLTPADDGISWWGSAIAE